MQAKNLVPLSYPKNPDPSKVAILSSFTPPLEGPIRILRVDVFRVWLQQKSIMPVTTICFGHSFGSIPDIYPKQPGSLFSLLEVLIAPGDAGLHLPLGFPISRGMGVV